MLELSPRLKMAAELVRKGSAVADIGTDHAYLPAYLLLNDIVYKALACDKRKGPLLNAEKTAKIYHLEDRLELRLSDGFDNIKPGEADDFVICGMGGSLTAELLSKAPWLKDENVRLILQPQSHSVDVRRFLIENGFEIEKETAVFDEGRVYNAMLAKFTGKRQDMPEGYEHFGALINNTDEASVYTVKRTIEYLKVRCRSEKEYGDESEAKKLERIILSAEESINDSQRNI